MNSQELQDKLDKLKDEYKKAEAELRREKRKAQRREDRELTAEVGKMFREVFKGYCKSGDDFRKVANEVKAWHEQVHKKLSIVHDKDVDADGNQIEPHEHSVV